MNGPVLAFDCSLGRCSVAIGSEIEVLAEENSVEGDDVSARLPVLIERSLKKSSLSPAELVGIIFTHGPGPFTSTRVSVAVAQGLQLSLKIPVLGFSSLENILLSVFPPTFIPHSQKELIVILPSHRRFVYYQSFSPSKEPLGDPYIDSVDNLVRSKKLDEALVVGPKLMIAEEAWYNFRRNSFFTYYRKVYARSLLHQIDRLEKTSLGSPLRPVFGQQAS
jgi:tRNA threonylcarbamoyl adenosine modification protein YeaZ